MRHSAMKWLAGLVIGMIGSGNSFSQAFPTGPVRMIVPLAAGGSTDIIARTIALKLGEIWGQAVLVENRTGGATIIGTDLVAKAPPDGHTLLMCPATIVTNPTLFPGKLPYDAERDFTPVVLVYTAPLVLVVPPGSQARTVRELVAIAKSRPGQLNYGSSTVGGTGHLSSELFNMMADVKIAHIPYKGNAPALVDLMAGRVEFVFNGTTSVLSLIQSGKLRALAVSGMTRVASLPDVPTLDEAGLRGFNSTAWNGLFASSQTSPRIIAKINADANKAIVSPEMLQRLKSDGSEPGGGSVQEFTSFVREETAKWSKVIKMANVKAE